ncbi:MAG: lysophospholipid acyltransferase family protein [Pseudomonadota bacterium]|nr:lysophospholipid acyltransferase family protein [Pseudomonadota bacterium]
MNIINIADTIMNRAARYHEHRVEGIEHIPASGPALIVVNHSLATYDSGLLAAAIKAKLGRDVWLLGDRYIFKVPVLRDLATAYGFVEGSQHNAESLLRDGELVLVAPGGMREALRPSSQKYQLDIRDRKGFARLAMRTGAPVILSACPAADDIYHVVSNPVTDWVYNRYKLAAPVIFGKYGTPIPKPARLVHYLNAPMSPAPHASEENPEDVDAFHARLENRLQAMLTAHADS